MQVDTNVDEADIGAGEDGMTVHVHGRRVPGRELLRARCADPHAPRTCRTSSPTTP